MAAIAAGSYGPEMDSIPAPSPGQLLELEQFARERTFNDRVLLAGLLPLVPLAHAEVVRRGDPEFVYSLLREASDIVWDLKYALTPLNQQDPYHGRLWRHSDSFPNPLKESPWSPDQEAAEAVAAAYLERPWMSAGYLDWSLVDALTRREILGYEAHIAFAMPRPWTSAWAEQKAFTVWIPWLIEVAIAAPSAGWLWFEFSSNDAPYRWWWAAGIGAYYAWWVLSFLISIPARIRGRRARRKELLATAERLQAMLRCYAELSGPVLDPTRVRDALLAAEKLEIRWSRATWPLLEAVIARHPHRWATGC